LDKLKNKITRYKVQYKSLFQKLKQNCTDVEPHQVAKSLTIGACIGIIPLFGITFITATAVGIFLKLNQFILQSTHLLVSPIQILLIPVFLNAGQKIFHHSFINTSFIIHEISHSSFLGVIRDFGSIMLFGFIVWLIFSIIVGTIMYLTLLYLLSPKVKIKQA
jgi:uncharacterized protein (DUF2062 family)